MSAREQLFVGMGWTSKPEFAPVLGSVDINGQKRKAAKDTVGHATQLLTQIRSRPTRLA
jgi:hypothetical protein